MKADKEEMTRLSTDKKKQFVCINYMDPRSNWLVLIHQFWLFLILSYMCPLQGPLVRWLKVNFSEAFIAWIHIKALRVFVESVLR